MIYSDPVDGHLQLHFGPEPWPVAYGQQGSVDSNHLYHDIQHFRQFIKHHHRWGLFSHDSYHFTVALLACIAEQKTLILPNNDQEGRLAELKPKVDTWLLDGLSSFNPLSRAHEPKVESVTINLPLNTHIELWTSGSSGKPKAIVKTLQQLFLEVTTLDQQFQPSCTQLYSTIPHFHIYGLLFKILWPLLSRRAFNRENSFTLEDFQAKLTQPQPNLLISCPAHLKRLPEILDLTHSKDKFPIIFSSGGACPSATSAWWSNQGMNITEIFGSTETGGVAYRTKAHLDEHWTTLPNVEIKTNNGTLLVHSPFTGISTWMEMGDLVEIDSSQRRFKLKGRADRIAKIEEKRISLIEMEERLCQLSEIDSAYVFKSEPTSNSHSSLHAVIKLNPDYLSSYYQLGHRLFIKTISAALKNYFEPMTLPKSWRLCLQLPVNEMGKTTPASCQYLFQQSFNETKTLPYILNLKKDSTINLSGEVPYQLDYLKGHFPQFPILAGVVQLDWVKKLSQRYFEKDFDFNQILRLKFKSILRPGDRFTLHISQHSEKHQLEFHYFQNNQTYSSGTFKTCKPS